MANPVEQIVLWFVELLSKAAANWATVRVILIAAFAGVLLWTLLMRLRNDSDPSIQYQSRSAAGSTSILLSGVHVTLALTAGIGLLAWPAPIESPLVGIVLAGIVVLHYVIEKREAMA